MKKIILLICLIFFITSCRSKTTTNNKILNKNFEEVEKSFESKDSFILYVGRSDCSDCILFEEELGNIPIPEEITFIKLDIKKYRDLANSDDATPENIAYYNKIKDFFKLSWTPTIYYVEEGKITLEYQYLDENYHSLSESEKSKAKEKFDKDVEKFIKNFNSK